MHLKKTLAGLLIITACLALAGLPASASAWTEAQPGDSWPSPDQIRATGWVVIDGGTGTVLLASNADTPAYPASTTKIMTAVLALEAGNLDRMITVSESAVTLPAGSSKVGLLAGEQLSLLDLLAGLMIMSGNDAANAIAETLGGSQEGFAVLMNDKAAALGMSGTHFVTSSGLHDDTHVTTARDMAVLAAYAMKNEQFRELVLMTSYSMPHTNLHPYDGWAMSLNTNRFLQFGDSVLRSDLIGEYLGIKTGSTNQAGNNLVSAARTVTGHELIAVILGVPMDDKIGNIYIYSRILLETAAAGLQPAESSTPPTETTDAPAATVTPASPGTETAAPTPAITSGTDSGVPPPPAGIGSFLSENVWRTAFLGLLALLLILLPFLASASGRSRRRAARGRQEGPQGSNRTGRRP